MWQHSVAKGAECSVKSESVTSLPHIFFWFLPLLLPQRCDDNISELFLALTTFGRQPWRHDEPRSAGTAFIHCDASSHRKCENRGSELAMPERGDASSENNGKERKDQTENSCRGAGVGVGG